MDNTPHINTINFFSMGKNFMYLFISTQYLITAPAEKFGFQATSKVFDEFEGYGRSRSTALTDWKSKFHGLFQLYELKGVTNESEECLYKKMLSSIDLQVYRANRIHRKWVKGVITNCRFGNFFPCSYKLEGSPDIYQVPDYSVVDPTFILLEKGSPFRALFEYNMDNKLQRILFGEELPTR